MRLLLESSRTLPHKLHAFSNKYRNKRNSQAKLILNYTRWSAFQSKLVTSMQEMSGVFFSVFSRCSAYEQTTPTKLQTQINVPEHKGVIPYTERNT